jgi:predicted DNA-binding protein (UPF0251 family)
MKGPRMAKTPRATPREIEAYKLCFVESCGRTLTQEEAAVAMGVTRARVAQLIASLRRKFPGVFDKIKNYDVLSLDPLSIDFIGEEEIAHKF